MKIAHRTPFVGLTAAVETTPERLIVSFIVTNYYPRPVYLFDRALVDGPEGTILPRHDHLLVRHEPLGGIVLASTFVPLSPHECLESAPTAMGTKVAPGGHYEGQASVRLPLRPDGVPADEELQALVVRHLRFELGYVIHDDELEPLRLTATDGPTYQLRAAAWRLRQVVAKPLLKYAVKGLVPRSPAELHAALR